jgi:hypothetical protein
MIRQRKLIEVGLPLERAVGPAMDAERSPKRRSLLR